MSVELVERGRAAYAAGEWSACWRALSAADRESPLDPDDLALLAVGGYLVGEDDASVEALGRAYNGQLAAGDPRLAARAAFYLSFILINTGAPARANGWVARCRALVDEYGLPAEAALLDAHRAHELLATGNPVAALAAAETAERVGRETGDAEARTLALLSMAHARIQLGRPDEAAACMDEVMLAVSGGELSPPLAGLAYCAVISACFRSHDLPRAREWTAALSSWCDVQSGLVPYRGECLVHRAELMTLAGEWTEAVAEATRACGQSRQPAAGEAYYRLGELHRLRGEYEAAEEAYRRANTCGRRPEPGLARLRLGQGRVDAAAVAVRRLHTEVHDPAVRADVLAGCVDVAVRIPDLPLATGAADELTAMADTARSPLLGAYAARAAGQAALLRGEPAAALLELRRSWRLWQELDVPYEAATVRVLIGECLRAVGEEDPAQMEFDAARWWFEQLGAVPDAARVTELAAGPRQRLGGLTDREVEVLRLVACGHTNRAVANELFLSEKTVARHVSNIFAKLGVGSRAAATAYAYDHGLVRPT